MYALPLKWFTRLLGHPTLRPLAANTGWLLIDKVLRMVFWLLVSAWVGRYLGPEDFGELAYVLATMAFFQILTPLGADQIVVRDIARNGAAAPGLLGTLLAMRLVAGAICWLAAVASTAVFSGPGDPTVRLVALAGGSLVFQAADTVDLWFQSQSQSKRTVLAKLGALLLSNGLKAVLIVLKAPVAAFAIVVTIEAALNALGLAVVYRRFRTSGPWRAAVTQAGQLLRQSYAFMLSGLSIVVYLRIDQIMIKNMLGERPLGIYAAALSISQLWYAIPTIVSVSLAPDIARRKAQGEQQYQRALLLLFRVSGAASLLIAAITALAAPILVKMLYGSLYTEAAPILAIHAFSIFFVFQGAAGGLWFANENAGHLYFMKTLLGGIAAVGANLMLLPRYGVTGAAVAALISFAIASVFSNLLFAPRIFLMQFGIRPPLPAVVVGSRGV
jgi:O-antigen/teichoic acid export membrane protein